MGVKRERRMTESACTDSAHFESREGREKGKRRAFGHTNTSSRRGRSKREKERERVRRRERERKTRG